MTGGAGLSPPTSATHSLRTRAGGGRIRLEGGSKPGSGVRATWELKHCHTHAHTHTSSSTLLVFDFVRDLPAQVKYFKLSGRVVGYRSEFEFTKILFFFAEFASF